MPRSKNIGRNRPDRVKGRELYWANRLAKAKTPKAQAAVEFDRLRVAAATLSPAEETEVWRELAAVIARRRQRITNEHGP